MLKTTFVLLSLFSTVALHSTTRKATCCTQLTQRGAHAILSTLKSAGQALKKAFTSPPIAITSHDNTLIISKQDGTQVILEGKATDYDYYDVPVYDKNGELYKIMSLPRIALSNLCTGITICHGDHSCSYIDDLIVLNESSAPQISKILFVGHIRTRSYPD